MAYKAIVYYPTLMLTQVAGVMLEGMRGKKNLRKLLGFSSIPCACSQCMGHDQKQNPATTKGKLEIRSMEIQMGQKAKSTDHELHPKKYYRFK